MRTRTYSLTPKSLAVYSVLKAFYDEAAKHSVGSPDVVFTLQDLKTTVAYAGRPAEIEVAILELRRIGALTRGLA